MPQPKNRQTYAPKPAPAGKVNGFSIAGFVLALVSALLTLFMAISDTDVSRPMNDFLEFFGGNVTICLVMAIAGLVLSIVGTVKSKKLGKGKGFGISGIVISALTIAVWLVIIGIIILVILSLSAL